jgi:6-pyruvoyltetrahydropterin/6-carboxytetrahydropterin synthase
VNVTIAGDDLDDSGFLVNFSGIKKLIHDRFDHTILNDHTELFSDKDPNFFPTTEGMARAVWEVIQRELDTKVNKPKCVQVFVRETPTSYVVFRPKQKEEQQ